MVVVELLAEEGAQMATHIEGTLLVAGMAVCEGYLLHEQGVLDGREGYLGDGLVEGGKGLPLLVAVGKIVGQQKDILPELLEELAAGLVDIDTFKGMPLHIVNKMKEEGIAIDSVVVLGGREVESECVAFKDKTLGQELAEVVVGVVGEIYGTVLFKTLGQEGLEIHPTDEADILDAHVGTFLLDGLNVPEGEGVVVAVGEKDRPLGVA